MVMVAPVIMPDSSLARNATARATSAGSSSRPVGCPAAASASQSGPRPWNSRWTRSSSSDVIQPMFRPLTRIRKKGARVLTANRASKVAGVVSRIVPRSVLPAAFTSTSSRPKPWSASSMTRTQSSTLDRSAATKRVAQPVSAVIRSATARPLSALRPRLPGPVCLP